MKNAIAERIHDFLKKFHPFKSIDDDNLFTIAQSSKIERFFIDLH